MRDSAAHSSRLADQKYQLSNFIQHYFLIQMTNIKLTKFTPNLHMHKILPQYRYRNKFNQLFSAFKVFPQKYKSRKIDFRFWTQKVSNFYANFGTKWAVAAENTRLVLELKR